eukprot:Hpha_TRINITY_DN15304_c0_g2::TRINITY_DN15304_c0_g2_i1::g.89562::m.89562/K20367/ERGIC3, ERV46; endoplasmic reticulum-Golgi intermediate compartment protein 3
MGVLNRFRRFDAYQKTHADFKDQWAVGALISVASLSLCTVLAWGEWGVYRQKAQQRHSLYVDGTLTGTLDIHVNLTYHSVPCALLHLDTVDAFGESHRIEATVNKTRLSKKGEKLVGDPIGVGSKPIEEEKAHLAKVQEEGYCGSCYGAEDSEGQCCNTCDSVRAAYIRKNWVFELAGSIEQCVKERLTRLVSLKSEEGCNIAGDFSVSRVQGSFHFAPARDLHKGGFFAPELLPLPEEAASFNTSHVIHKLAFGKEFPGMVSPLDGRSHRLPDGDSGLFQFFIKIVPTLFEPLDGAQIETNQFSVTEHFQRRTPTSAVIPGVYFNYDLSPIKVHIYETHHYKSILHFLASVCAAVGGVFTVAGLIDSVLYHSHRTLAKND